MKAVRSFDGRNQSCEADNSFPARLGRPLWGWHEELPPTPDLLAIDKKALWGVVNIEEESDEEEEEMAVEDGEEEQPEEADGEPMQPALTESELSRGLESVSGIETPSDMQLRKFS